MWTEEKAAKAQARRESQEGNPSQEDGAGSDAVPRNNARPKRPAGRLSLKDMLKHGRGEL